MTKFHVPDTTSDAEAEQTIAAIAKFIGAPLPARPDRIESLTWVRGGNRQFAHVGANLLGWDNELVYAILHDGKNFCVCTPHHGVLSGYPIYVGPDELTVYSRFTA